MIFYKLPIIFVIFNLEIIFNYMENYRIINLSFDDKSIKVSHSEIDKTIVSMVSYFRGDKLTKFMKELGYVNMPDVVVNILKESGYTYNHKLNAWTTKTTGVATLDEYDEYDSGKGIRIATTKAKVKAYKKSYNCLTKIMTAFTNTSILFGNSAGLIGKYYQEELEALERVIETGYCNPEKK